MVLGRFAIDLVNLSNKLQMTIGGLNLEVCPVDITCGFITLVKLNNSLRVKLGTRPKKEELVQSTGWFDC